MVRLMKTIFFAFDEYQSYLGFLEVIEAWRIAERIRERDDFPRERERGVVWMSTNINEYCQLRHQKVKAGYLERRFKKLLLHLIFLHLLSIVTEPKMPWESGLCIAEVSILKDLGSGVSPWQHQLQEERNPAIPWRGMTLLVSRRYKWRMKIPLYAKGPINL